jgi:hypothetical protein
VYVYHYRYIYINNFLYSGKTFMFLQKGYGAKEAAREPVPLAPENPSQNILSIANSWALILPCPCPKARMRTRNSSQKREEHENVAL